MNSFKKLCLVLFIGLNTTAYSQISGNQIYGNNNNHYNSGYVYNNSPQKRSIVTTDSTFTISINLLLNKQADYYMVTVGLNQEEKTVIACNQKINQRIEAF